MKTGKLDRWKKLGTLHQGHKERLLVSQEYSALSILKKNVNSLKEISLGKWASHYPIHTELQTSHTE